MSTLATTDPKELRPLLRERIEHATDAELEAVRKALLLFEAKRTFDELGREMDEDWRSGKITEEKFADCAIAAGADYILTNDHHFDVLIGSGHKAQPIAPEEFIRRHLAGV